MKKVLNLNVKVVAAVYVLVDLLCVGVGMGVPIFCILLGFPVGWYSMRRAVAGSEEINDILRKALVYSIVASLFTFIIMAVIWGPTISMLFDPKADFKNFGIPMILYDPRISFIGWEVLMILISPFLQLLATIFAAYLTLIKWLKNNSPKD